MAAAKRLGSTPRHFRAGSRVLSLPGPASTAAPLPYSSMVESVAGLPREPDGILSRS